MNVIFHLLQKAVTHLCSHPNSVKDTDWRAELESFSKGVAEDSAEATHLVHKGLEGFPKEATAHLPAGLSAGLEGLGEHISAGVDSGHLQEHLNKVPAADQ